MEERFPSVVVPRVKGPLKDAERGESPKDFVGLPPQNLGCAG